MRKGSHRWTALREGDERKEEERKTGKSTRAKGNQRRKPELERCEMDTDRCSRSRSVATVAWASPRGCCRCRRPPARTVKRQSGCSGCCCCYHCCYRFLRCQLVMQPTNQKTSYCQPPNSFLPVASGRFFVPSSFDRCTLAFLQIPNIIHRNSFFFHELRYQFSNLLRDSF